MEERDRRTRSQSASVDHRALFSYEYTQTCSYYETSNKGVVIAAVIVRPWQHKCHPPPSLPVTAMRLARHRDKWRSDSVSIDTEALLQRLLQKAFHSCHCAERQWCTNTRLLQWTCQLRDALIEEHYFLYIWDYYLSY